MKKERTSYKERREAKGKYNWRQHLKPKTNTEKSVSLEQVNYYLDQLANALVLTKEKTGDVTEQDITYNTDIVKRVLAN